jgi:hypothetical protein
VGTAAAGGGMTALERAFSLWLACYTEQEIAEKVGRSHDAVNRVLRESGTYRFCVKPGEFAEIEDEEERWAEHAVFMEIGNLAESHKIAASHLTDFHPPIYNVWKQQIKNGGR